MSGSTATSAKLWEALDANADAAKEFAGDKAAEADAAAHSALKLAQALATLSSAELI